MEGEVIYRPGQEDVITTKDIYTLEIDLPFVNGTYEVRLPSKVTMKTDGKMATGKNDNPWFKNYGKKAVTIVFTGPPKPSVRGPTRTAENAPGFTAPARKALAQQDNKALNKALKGYQKRLKQYQGFKQPTEEVQRSMGELKEAIRIAKELVEVQKEADRLGGTIAGMDFIPGTTAFFNAMRQWKRSKLPLSDRKKLDSLVRRSNKLHNKWVAEGRVDREMEGRLEKLSDEIVALESKVENQIPTETEMVKIDQNIKWPSRTRDLRRTHKKQRDLSEKLKETGIEDVDENYRDIKLEVTKGRTESQKDFTQEEINIYEEILDIMSAKGGYIDDLTGALLAKEVPSYSELGPDAGYRKRWIGKRMDKGLIWHKVMKSPLQWVFPYNYQIKVMGKSGKELADHNSKFVARLTEITGEGDAVIKKIHNLIGKKKARQLTAAIDPYLADGMEIKGREKFLNDPKIKEARQLWQDYTDHLQAMREKYNTWVQIEIEKKPGVWVKKRVKAKDTYIDNWIRRQLSVKTIRDFAKEGDLFNKEAQKLITKGKAKTLEEAHQMLGEWMRISPHIQTPVRYGSMDRPRMVELSPELYETDFNMLSTGIARRSANFLAAAEVYDQTMKIRDNLVSRISSEVGRNAGTQAAKYMDYIVEGHRDGMPLFMSMARAVGAGYLSGPRSFSNNVIYSTNTDMPAFMYRGFVKGWEALVRNPQSAMMTARKAGQLGVGVREMEQMTFTKGAMQWLSPWIKPSEYLNRAKSTIGAGTAREIYFRYLSNSISPEIKRLMPPSWRRRMKAKTARLFFKDFGSFSDAEIDRFIKRGFMTEAEKKRVESFAPSVAQGSTHPYFMPPVFSGKMSFLGALQKMSYRATAGIVKGVIKPAGHGDLGPMFRWIAAGAIGGELSYLINWAAWGWEHPEGGDLNEFIKWVKADGIELNDAQKIWDRVFRNMIRASSAGFITDTMRGYGMVPIVWDAYKNISKDIGYVITGDLEFKQALDDIGTSQIAAYRDWYRVKQAWFSPRAAEHRNYDNVLQYKYAFDKKLKDKERQDYPLSRNEASFRHIEEAWWNIPYMENMPVKEKEKIILEFDKIMWASKNTIADRNIQPYLEKNAEDRGTAFDGKYMLKDAEGKWTIDGTADKIAGETRDAEDSAFNVVKRFHPLHGLAGRLQVNYNGLIYDLKPTGDKSESDARDFWDNLKDYQKKNVLNAVGYYNNNYRELKLDRYVK